MKKSFNAIDILISNNIDRTKNYNIFDYLHLKIRSRFLIHLIDTIRSSNEHIN